MNLHRAARASNRAGEATTLPAYVPIREVAVALGLSEGRTYALIAAGSIPALREGRRIRVPRAAFERWLEQQAETALQNVKRAVSA